MELSYLPANQHQAHLDNNQLPDRRKFLQISSAAIGALSLGTANPKAHAQETSLTPQQLAAKAIRASVYLSKHVESGTNAASAVLVKTPPNLQELLNPGEFLLVSATHNFWDWDRENNQVSASFFYNFDSSLEPKNSITLPARLISRFKDSDVRTRDGFVDISILAIQCPLTKADGTPNPFLSYFHSVALDIAPNDHTHTKGEQLIAVGSPGYTPEEAKHDDYSRRHDYDKPMPPQWRSGQVIGTETRESLTNFGKIQHTTYNTTVRAIKGESGGALVNEKLQVVGICSGGGFVGKNLIDFEVPGLDKIWTITEPGTIRDVPEGVFIARSPQQAAQKARELQREAGGFAMDAEWRGAYQHIGSFHLLSELVCQKYSSLKQEEAQIIDDWNSLKDAVRSPLRPARESTALTRLNRNMSKRLAAVQEQIHELKPPVDQ
ncbi:MAG: hypothetical protein KDD62_09055 [Bdellovibrionales bacterium]|nr:hypothetical protein [Bdellovibrionales bacterium]